MDTLFHLSLFCPPTSSRKPLLRSGYVPLFSIAVTNGMTKGNWGEKILFGYTSQPQSFKEGRLGRRLKQGRNPEAGPEAEPMEEHCFPACSANILIQPRPSRLGVALTTVCWALPHQSATKKVPCRYGLDLMEEFFQFRIPIPR